MNDLISRVMYMEKCMECVEKAYECGDLKPVQRQIDALRNYMDSGRWLQDYQADERGELPKSMKRGVLSEDGLYNLLCDIENR